MLLGYVLEQTSLLHSSFYKLFLKLFQAFRTTVQAILRTAKEKRAKSIAFPSLGVGNLHFPAHVSSKLILEEIIAFHQQNPGCDIQHYYIVAYEESTFQEYNKVYTQKMNSSPPQKKVISKGAALFYISLIV